MQVILAVAPADRRDALRYTRQLAHAAYRIGADSALLRRESGGEVHGGLLVLSDQDAPAEFDAEKLSVSIVRECDRRGYRGVLIDQECTPPETMQPLARLLVRRFRRRRAVFVPEGCDAPGSITVINTAISGGSYQQRLQEAQRRYGTIALDVQRLIMDFSLPSPQGTGTLLTLQQLQQRMEGHTAYFSPELCARYFTCMEGGNPRFVLFDDADTIRRKLRLASSLGISTAFLTYPEVADLLPQLFGSQRN